MKKQIPMAERPEQKRSRIKEERSSKIRNWIIFLLLVALIAFVIWSQILS
jgi:predicted nucleic acid-binding Zn ribbon protein